MNKSRSSCRPGERKIERKTRVRAVRACLNKHYKLDPVIDDWGRLDSQLYQFRADLRILAKLGRSL